MCGRPWRAFGFSAHPSEELLRALDCWPRGAQGDMMLVLEHMLGGSLEAALAEVREEGDINTSWLCWDQGGQGLI